MYGTSYDTRIFPPFQLTSGIRARPRHTHICLRIPIIVLYANYWDVFLNLSGIGMKQPAGAFAGSQPGQLNLPHLPSASYAVWRMFNFFLYIFIFSIVKALFCIFLFLFSSLYTPSQSHIGTRWKSQIRKKNSLYFGIFLFFYVMKKPTETRSCHFSIC